MDKIEKNNLGPDYLKITQIRQEFKFNMIDNIKILEDF